MASNSLSQLTAIIPTSGRQKSLGRLVRSIRKVYPKLGILVADESGEKIQCKQADCLQLPEGVGRSAACNAMLARLRTPYFLMLDGRCEFTSETNIESLLDLVKMDLLDVAAGELTSCQKRLLFFVKRQPHPGHATFDIAGDSLTLNQGYRTVGEGYYWCDMVSNFYVARTDKVRNMGGWDQDLVNDEREEFFFRGHRNGLRVGVSPDVTALQWQEREKASQEESSVNMKTLATAKMGLARMTDIDGREYKAPRRAMAA